ncbi:uncharacterized protein [Palaemon carinicauda]|uniref:uncharacterized protein n=1 Tax=Palaemon carinicauda TaxID=392227 RepID=UPI0035B62787
MMSLKFILLGALVAFVAGYEPDAPPVLVELFCDIDPPSCRWEMGHDLPETYHALKDTGIMNLYLNFYGKTEEPIGPGEFYEHRLAECAIFYNNNNDTLIEYFNCFMTEEHFPEAPIDGKHCAESVGIDWSVLEGCYLSEEGEELLIKAGVKYHSMKPPISLYPEYYLNGHPRVQAYAHLLEYVCEAYTGTPPPACETPPSLFRQ